MPDTPTCIKVALLSDKKSYPIKTIYSIVVLFLFVSCALIFHQFAPDILSYIDNLGSLAPILFVISYGLAAILFLPTMVFALAGGALFGPVTGTLLNLLGAIWGAAISFLITRYFMHDWFTKKCGSNMTKLVTGVNKSGWMFVAFLRLIPIVPFNLVNYGLGVTGIPFRLYLIITSIFLIPAEIIYTYFGHAGKDILTNPEQFYKSGGIIFLGLAIILLTVITLLKKKHQLKKLS